MSPETVPSVPDVSLGEYTRAILNILEDFAAEQDRSRETQTAVLNILEDFGGEKDRLSATQTAVLNILDDFASEKARLESTQKAMLNILEDFDGAKGEVEDANVELRREVAERRQAEQALREQSRALARSNAELEQFAYVASHDLQEPLRMVGSYVQLLSSRYQGQLDGQADKYIGYAVEGARRMQALIAALLEYSRVGRENKPARISSGAAVEQALRNLKPAIEETGAVVSSEPLPDVVADAGQMVQVFQNLVGNAVKFRTSNARPRIRISAARRGHECVFAVSDNGIGIDPTHAERIFVIFQRLHTRAEYPGTGIGLAICKKIVERLGGRIWVESEPGRGATFYFSVPAAEGDP